MKENVKVKAKMATTWQRALNFARRTVGKEALEKEPSAEWKKKMLIAEHSPIRAVEYDISFENVRQWVTVHLVRHWLGFIPFVHSQRADRRQLDCSRDELPQGALNDMDVAANAQALINISRKRLCSAASKETREAWQKTKEAIAEIDPVMASVMVRECVYRGFCSQKDCACGYDKTEAFIEELKKYRGGNMAKEQQKEDKFAITPKGILQLCLLDVKIDVTENEMDAIWTLFEARMEKNGYLAKE